MDRLRWVYEAVEWLVGLLGPGWALTWLVAGIGIAASYRVYQDHRRDKWMGRALDEKERTIQRLASQERQWRKLWLVERNGMNRRTVEKIIDENEYGSPKESREALEKKRSSRG